MLAPEGSCEIYHVSNDFHEMSITATSTFVKDHEHLFNASLIVLCHNATEPLVTSMSVGSCLRICFYDLSRPSLLAQGCIGPSKVMSAFTQPVTGVMGQERL